MATKTKQNVFHILKWGKDHWCLLSYCETRSVDYGGILDLKHMRVNSDKRGFSNGANHWGDQKWDKAYSTRLEDGKKPDPTHDDLDVLEELQREGFLSNIGTLLNPIVKLTDTGIEIAHRLRRHKINGGNFNGFSIFNEENPNLVEKVKLKS